MQGTGASLLDACFSRSVSALYVGEQRLNPRLKLKSSVSHLCLSDDQWFPSDRLCVFDFSA